MKQQTLGTIRRQFADLLYLHMTKNKNIWVVSGDMGYRMLDPIRETFPDRFVNTGAAETAMIGVAVGLALDKKIPVVFTITSFLLYRPFETIRNYLHHEKIPVKLVGSGRNTDYHLEGFSHWAEEDKKVMNILSNITSVWCQKNDDFPALVDRMINDDQPWYLNLSRY